MSTDHTSDPMGDHGEALTQLIKEEYIQSDSPIAVDVPRFGGKG